MKDLINKSIEEHHNIIKYIDQELIGKVSKSIIDALSSDNTVFWCGNGGSASQANHLSAELVGGMYKKKIRPLKSLCLNVDTTFITAWSNDDSYDNIFNRQLEALSKEGDILFGLSTSGNSNNIINASKYAQSKGLKVISLTGNDGGKLKKNSDLNINIQTNNTQRIQEMHILIGHIICDLVENHFNS